MTERQRDWLLKRDGNSCQFLHFRGGKTVKCFEKGKLHVHHILSQRFIAKWFPEMDPDSPYNMICICEGHHNFIHPDVTKATISNLRDQAFDKMFEKRDEIVSRGLTYWTTSLDAVLSTIARLNTQAFSEVFPEKKVKSK